ncbi:MAG: hypothetical protein AB1Z98_07320, partial [Nannocystaceae bacterium]
MTDVDSRCEGRRVLRARVWSLVVAGLVIGTALVVVFGVIWDWDDGSTARPRPAAAKGNEAIAPQESAWLPARPRPEAPPRRELASEAEGSEPAIATEQPAAPPEACTDDDDCGPWERCVFGRCAEGQHDCD